MSKQIWKEFTEHISYSATFFNIVAHVGPTLKQLCQFFVVYLVTTPWISSNLRYILLIFTEVITIWLDISIKLYKQQRNNWYQLTQNWRSMKWYFSSTSNLAMLHATVRTAMLKQSRSIGLFGSKISLIVLRVIEIGYGLLLRTHCFLKSRNQNRRKTSTSISILCLL
jgi:hypothetical protein